MEASNHNTEIASTNTAKCAHPICSCLAISGKYCSVECEAMEKMPDIDCRCEHNDCAGHTH
jgi:hypothetical protein